MDHGEGSREGSSGENLVSVEKHLKSAVLDVAETGLDGTENKSSESQSLKWSPYRKQMVLEWHNVTYSIAFLGKKNWNFFQKGEIQESNKFTILKNVSGIVRPGELLAVMGPSGGGKTTLLNALAGRANFVSEGVILFDKRPRVADTRRKIGYVVQDDVFFTHLTVRQTLEITARLRLPRDVSYKDKMERVEYILQRLGLLRCQNTIIGDQFKKGISGGERKRTNIADVLLVEPSILILDEPTSGLDSNTALTVVRLLRELASEGRTVITTIHQPNSMMFAEFDKLLLLASGQTVYYGPAKEAVVYFSRLGYECPYGFNPADYFIALLTNEDFGQSEPIRQKLIDAWKEYEIDADLDYKLSEEKLALEQAEAERHRSLGWIVKDYFADVRSEFDTSSETGKYPTTFFEQLRVLAWRAYLQKKGKMFELLTVFQVSFIALIVSFIWFRIPNDIDHLIDLMGALFFAGLFWGFFTLFQSLTTLPAEKPVLSKERASGAYRLSAYFLGKALVEIPLDLIYPFFFSVYIYWMLNLNPQASRFILFLVFVGITVFTAQSIGIFIAAVFMDFRKSQTLAAVFMLTSMLTGGFFVSDNQMPVWIQWIQYLSFIHYIYDSFMLNQFEGEYFPCPPGNTSGVTSSGLSCPLTAQDIYSMRGVISNIGRGGNIAIVLAYGIAFRYFAFLGLKYLNRSHKQKRRV
ncbi:ABC transporter, ATP-binding protein [Galdieria sulphuraria]|uniref:Probable ATP-dependent transporter ycf16 n=1 Tax=Galdieria sulphuraria TaxID=130081 RepID=M2WUR1_GALSU|nr:ABC transporter, ATP-binding protein [Galdieria sulphuraria]EME27695.1 ABC transporter, ATP-binding protein [Galdieria sulphuraria]|eukprot:XP_005704215.1 ABC transporter, ATP-binding protein [Galdieria sulphuraria]